MSSCCCGGGAQAVETPPVEGRFSLVDHHGQSVDEGSYGDKYLLVLFGFSHCAVVCPRELAKLSNALALAGPVAQRVQPLYITVDPERDTPAVLKEYLHRSAPAFTGLTGTTEEIETVKRRFRVFSRKVSDAQAPGEYAVQHTAMAYLLAPGGRYITHFADSLDAPQVAQGLRQSVP